MLTPCKDCVFALYKEKTQVGCELGKLFRFFEHDIPIILAYDEEKEFFLIEGLCPFFRNQTWAAKQTNPIEAVMLETQIKYHVIIINEGNIEAKIDAILSQDIKPQTLTVINRKADEIKKLNDLLKTKRVNEWRIQNTALDDLEAVDIAVNSVKQPIYLFLKENLDKDFSLKLNKKIGDLTPFQAMTSKESYLSTKAVHDFFGGNFERNFLDKLDKERVLPLEGVHA